MARALSILEALIDESLSLTELGRRTGLQPSTTHRMLATLTRRGYVYRDPTDGRYALGPRAALLAGETLNVGVGIGAIAAPYMTRVHRVCKHQVNLTMLRGTEVIFIDQLRTLDTHRRPGVAVPAHASASGKAMLAFAKVEPSEELARCTAHTIVRPTTLMRELEQIESVGYAIDREEYREGMVCIAAPILDGARNVLGALSVSGKADDLTEDTYGDLGELVRGAAADASGSVSCDPRFAASTS